MDWIKHFIICKLDSGIETNGLKQGLCYNIEKNEYTIYSDNKSRGGSCYCLFGNGKIKYIIHI